MTSSLWFWDASGPVRFDPVKPSTVLNVSKASSLTFSSNFTGTASDVPGFVIETTDVVGFLHKYIDFSLVDPLTMPEGYLWSFTFAAGAYLHDPRTRGITPDPERAPHIRRVFERYAQGYVTFSQRRILAAGWGLHGKGGNGLPVSRIHRILTNHLYHGMISLNGALGPGTHTPIVSKELFDHVQRVMLDRGKPRKQRKKAVHPWQGMFRCGECGCAITVERQKGHLYLRCTKARGSCSQRYLREEAAHGQVREAIRLVSLRPPDADALMARLEREANRLLREADTRMASLESERAAVEQKKRRLTEVYLDGHFSVEEYTRIKNPLVLREQEIRYRIGEFRDNLDERLELAQTFTNGLKQAFLLATSDDLRAQCQFLRIVASNRLLKDQKISVEPVGAWKAVASSGPNGAGVAEADRVSGPIRGNILKGEASGRLLDVLKQTPMAPAFVLDTAPPGSSDKAAAAPSTSPSTPLEGQTPAGRSAEPLPTLVLS